jgi:hypothetical protein
VPGEPWVRGLHVAHGIAAAVSHGRIVAGIRGVEIARFRDERSRKVCSASARKDSLLPGHVFEVTSKESGIQLYNPVRDVNERNDALGSEHILLGKLAGHCEFLN